jgi:hypothetical protein
MKKFIFILFGSTVILFTLLACKTCSNSDLVPTEIALSSDNVLKISFENQGEEEVPANKGDLALFIDGKKVDSYELGNLTDQSFRSPGNNITLNTNFRISGVNRRIAVILDTQNEINESGEFQNSLSRSITPPAINGPDYIINGLSTNSLGQLKISIQNIGNEDSPGSFSPKLRVVIDESFTADFTPNISTISAYGGSITITPTPPIQIVPRNKVRVMLNTFNILDEVDNLNNCLEEILPDGPSYTAYSNILNQPRISNNIIWESTNGVQNYNNWTSSMKASLRDAILLIEKGKYPGLTGPPALIEGTKAISAIDAWQIFLTHIAQSLWIEKNGIVSWHLTDMPDEQLMYLLDSRKLLSFHSSLNLYAFSDAVMGNVTSWSPCISFEFLSNFDLIKGDQENTVNALTNWMRAHLNHIGGDQSYEEVYDYSGPPPVERILYPIKGNRHITAGCWGTSGLYCAILRSINIPVAQAGMELDGKIHSRPNFVSIDKSMPHSDDVYSEYTLPSGNAIPISGLFFSSSEMDSMFISPTIDCNGSDCNTSSEQASYNSTKHELEISWTHKSDFLPYKYAIGGPNYVKEYLRGNPTSGGIVTEYVYPYFSEAESDRIVSEVTAYLVLLGKGDIEEGKKLVKSRFQRFLENK